MNPKLPLDGRIYILTLASVLSTNVSQINLCQLLFRATLKVRLDSCLSLFLELTTLTAHDILRILVKAQPSTRSTWPRCPTRLGIRSQDLGLPSEYSLGHCGPSAASRHKLAFTSRHYALLTATDTTALY